MYSPHFLLAPLDDSYPLSASQAIYHFVVSLKDHTYLTHAPEVPFLEIDVKGEEREHIKAYHMSTSKLFQMLVKPRGEKSHVF